MSCDPRRQRPSRQSWPWGRHVGLWVEPEYDVIFRDGTSSGLGATGGVLFGQSSRLVQRDAAYFHERPPVRCAIRSCAYPVPPARTLRVHWILPNARARVPRMLA